LRDITLPTFILAGAPKSGSSSLWQYLRQHPEVYLPDQKELFYFDFNFEKGVEWYSEFFSGHQTEAAIGEATVWYMRWSTVPKRMSELLPNVKLIFVLRNPVDRAYSNWCHEKRDGIHPFDQTFEDFLKREDRDSRTIISSGYYSEHLERFLRYFPRGQIHICFTEDLKSAPKETCKDIFDFIGVNPEFEPDLSFEDNVSWWFGSFWILRVSKAILTPYKFIFGENPIDFMWRKSRHFRSLFWRRGERPPKCSEADRETLKQEYKPHIEALETLLKRSLSQWKT